MLKSAMLLRLGLALLLLFWAAWAQAAVPNTISYQGVLTDSGGAPVTNATQSMTFRLYDAATSGSLLWTENQTVAVQNGIYTVQLGAVTPITANTLTRASTWLEIQVGSEVLAGRLQLDSVPFALQAAKALSADTATNVTGTVSGNGAGLTNVDWANLVNVPAGFSDNTDNVATSVNGMSGGLITGPITVNIGGSSPAGYFRASGTSSSHGIEGLSIDSNTTDTLHAGVYGFGNGGQRTYGLYGEAYEGTVEVNGVAGFASGNSVANRGVYGNSSGPGNSSSNNYGVYGSATGAPRNYGVYGFSGSGGISDTNYAVYGEASGSSINYAVYAKAFGGITNVAGYFDGDESDGTSKAAVKIVSPGQTMLLDGNEIDSDVALHLNYTSTQDVDIAKGGGNVGIGSIASASYKLFVNGDIFATSGVSVNGWTQASDRRFKTNIQTLPNALYKVSLLRGVSYDWRVDEFPERGFSDDPQIGVIAQEVEAVVPELVHTDVQGYKSVAYDKLTAVLIEAVKTLKSENEELKILVCQDHPTAVICQ